MTPEFEAASQFDGDGVSRGGAVARALCGDILQLIDFLVIIVTSVCAAVIYHRLVLETEIDIQKYAAAGIMGATGLTALLRRDGYYEFDKLLSPFGGIRAIAARWLLVVLGILAFGFALKISESFSRGWLFSWTVSTILIFAVLRFVAASVLRAMSRSGGLFTRRIAIVGSTNLAREVADNLGEVAYGVSIVGLYASGFPDAGDAYRGPTAGDLNDLAAAARNGEIDDIIVAEPRSERSDMTQLIRRLSALPVSVAICPNRHWLDHQGGEISRIGEINVLSLYRRPLEGWGGVMKSLEDYVLGSALLIALSPVLLAIAIAIKLQGKGPILFSQKRHGFNNAVFRIYKFRTMTVAEDGDIVQQAQENDPRITPLGGFLRRYSLDELPQLFNVVRGEMSLVGPRPHALAHNHQYARAIENYSGRHKVKPGITGWAQVNGYRGETSENEQMAMRVKYDLAYVDNWSLWFDFKILILTVKAVVFPKNAV